MAADNSQGNHCLREDDLGDENIAHLSQIEGVDLAGGGVPEGVFAADVGEAEGDDAGEGGERREKELCSGEGVVAEDLGGVADEDKPAAGGATDAAGVGSFREVEGVDLVVEEVEEAAVAALVVEAAEVAAESGGVGRRRREEEPGELGREGERTGRGKEGAIIETNGTEADVIGVYFEGFGDGEE